MPIVYAPLAPDRPDWGSVAILPWDTENFGFRVGDWRPGDHLSTGRARDDVRRALSAWANENRIELVSARVAAQDARGRLLLALLGFEFIDCSVDVEIADLQSAAVPPPTVPIRPAERADHPEIVRIAEEAFQLDRYHADARFPRGLPELRHRRWMERLLASNASDAKTYTIGDPGRPLGLLAVTFSGDGTAEILLAAVDVARHAGGIGFSLFAGALAALKQAGTRRCISKQYAANTAIMNVFARVGFRFTGTQALYHWHSPGATCLLGLEQIFSDHAC